MVDTISIVLFAVALLVVIYVLAKLPLKNESKTDTGLTQSLITAPSDLARNMTQMAEDSAHPTDLLANVEFKRAVSIFSEKSCSVEHASNSALGANWILSYTAYEALSRRGGADDLVEKALNVIQNASTVRAR